MPGCRPPWAPHRLWRRQVPADGRLRHALRRPRRRRRPRTPRRAPRRRHHRHARGLRELQRRHARHLDGRGPDLRRGRGRRRLGRRRRRLDHGHPLRRRERGRLGRQALPHRRQRRHRDLARRRLRGRGRVLRHRRHQGHGHRHGRQAPGGQGAHPVRGRQHPLPAQLGHRHRSRRCRGRATGSRSTPPCTPTEQPPPRTLGRWDGGVRSSGALVLAGLVMARSRCCGARTSSRSSPPTSARPRSTGAR